MTADVDMSESKQARRHDELIAELLDSRIPKTEREHAASREIEALRAELEDYRTNGAAAVKFAPGSAYWSDELNRLFGGDARTGIGVLESRYQQERTRAERLTKALRDAEKSLRTIADRAGGTEYLMTIGDVRGYANSRANEARDALEQENRNG